MNHKKVKHTFCCHKSAIGIMKLDRPIMSMVYIADKHILLKHFWQFYLCVVRNVHMHGNTFLSFLRNKICYCTLVLVGLYSLFRLHLEMSGLVVIVKFCHLKKHSSSTNDHFWHSSSSSVGATTLGGSWPALRFCSTIFYLYTSVSSFSLSSSLDPLLLGQAISVLVFLLVLMNMVPIQLVF